MPTIALSALLSFLAAPTWAASFNLEITFPNREVKKFAPNNSELIFKLDSKKWNCKLQTTKTVETVMGRVIICTGPQGTTVSLPIACDPNRQTSANMGIGDKGKDHLVAITCMP